MEKEVGGRELERKKERETTSRWENTAGEEILIEIGWFWVKSGSLWHIWMHSLLLVLINDSCTIVCWQSLPYRHNFFLYETLLKMQPNQIWPLNNMCYHHCTVNWDWLVTSCDKVGKRASSFSRKEKKKNKKLNCVKTITICSTKQHINQNTLTVFKYHKSMCRGWINALA